MSGRERPIVASVEDADESGNAIKETARYASSVAPSSPAKEQPNTSRTRRGENRRGSSPVTTSVVTDSDSTLHPRRDSLKKPSKDREKSASKKALMPSSRPSVKHAKTTPSMPRRDDPSCYGIDPVTLTPAATRPRAPSSRPTSYSAPPRPPPSNARFYAGRGPGAPHPLSAFSPNPWTAPTPGLGPIPHPFNPATPAPLVMHHHPPSHAPPYPPPSEFPTRSLESRFGSTRPQSAMGFRPSHQNDYDDYEEPHIPIERTLARRPSTTRKVSKNEEDRRAMPPPRRPSSARPTTLAFRPPPPAPAVRRVDFEDHEADYDDTHALFHDSSPLAPLDTPEYGGAPIPFQPRPSYGDFSYDVHNYHPEAGGKSRRRNSYYGGYPASSGSAYEDKMRLAARYQEDITGGPQLPLTAESLRKADRSGASSRSTRSSGSNDESEYRQSATTRTTRSTAPNDDDLTIRVKGSSVLKIGNAQMQLPDGAEVNFSSRGGNAEIRTGSDRSSYIEPDDRRTRVDMPPARTRVASRARSRARSYSRPLSRYESGAQDYDTYTNYAPPLNSASPYGEFSSSYSSRHADGYFGPSPFEPTYPRLH